jgi:alpha-aminoadipate carrier protein LysW
VNDNQNKIVCPDCGAEIKQQGELNLGDILECQECGTEVEIVSVEPLKYSELIEQK